MSTQTSSMKYLVSISLLIVIGALAYFILNAPDRRNAGEKISDAVNELPNGVDKASRQLQDRTPAEKIKDAAKDAGEDIKKSTNQQ